MGIFGLRLVVLGRCLEPWVGFTKELGGGEWGSVASAVLR